MDEHAYSEPGGIISSRFCGVVAKAGISPGYWGPKKLTYAFGNYLEVGQVHRSNQIALTRLMFDHIESLVDLKFDVAASTATANVVFSKGRGPRANFDGPQGTLAYAYLPPIPDFDGQLGCYFDMDEAWSGHKPEDVSSPPSGILFWNVLYHEVLHNLGLDHSSRQQQLMSPTYAWNIQFPQQEDIARLQSLYGRAKASPVAPSVPSTGDVTKKLVELLGTDTLDVMANGKKVGTLKWS